MCVCVCVCVCGVCVCDVCVMCGVVCVYDVWCVVCSNVWYVKQQFHADVAKKHTCAG